FLYVPPTNSLVPSPNTMNGCGPPITLRMTNGTLLATAVGGMLPTCARPQYCLLKSSITHSSLVSCAPFSEGGCTSKCPGFQVNVTPERPCAFSFSASLSLTCWANSIELPITVRPDNCARTASK